MELLLAERSATRYMLLNFFHATAQANARKLADARKLIESFQNDEQILSRPMQFPRPGRLVLCRFLSSQRRTLNLVEPFP